jgi:phage terminase large subunit-like protein
MAIKQMALRYPTTQIIGVEAVGKGEEFYNLLLRSSRLPIIPMHTGRKSKGTRFEKGMAPLFQYKRVYISDLDNPFLQDFKDEWVKWPSAAHDDTLDAVYWMLYAGAPHLFEQQTQKPRKKNPFDSLNKK